MNFDGVPFKRIGLVVALVGGCHGDGPVTESKDSLALATQSLGAGCVSHQGFDHCPLGTAKLTQSGGATLRVSNLFSADKDGVAIVLPEVTEFSATGWIMPSSDGAVVLARSINEGVSTSTMTMKKAGGGYVVSAAFTGNGNASTYSLHVYDSGELVASRAGLSGGGGTPVFLANCAPGSVNYPACLTWVLPPVFRVIPTGPNAGACEWALVAREGGTIRVRLADGTVAVGDRVELEEEVPASGSYPYLTFNRIDYTSSSGTIVLENESVQ